MWVGPRRPAPAAEGPKPKPQPPPPPGVQAGGPVGPFTPSGGRHQGQPPNITRRSGKHHHCRPPSPKHHLPKVEAGGEDLVGRHLAQRREGALAARAPPGCTCTRVRAARARGSGRGKRAMGAQSRGKGRGWEVGRCWGAGTGGCFAAAGRGQPLPGALASPKGAVLPARTRTGLWGGVRRLPACLPACPLQARCLSPLGPPPLTIEVDDVHLAVGGAGRERRLQRRKALQLLPLCGGCSAAHAQPHTAVMMSHANVSS